MSEDFRWQIRDGRWVHENPFYRVREEAVRTPTGKDLQYYVVHPRRFGVGIVPVADDGRVLLVQQWRHPVQKLLWEIPAGGIDTGETPEQAAGRELVEETGFSAGTIEPLYAYHPQVGSTNQTFHLCIGRELKRVGQSDPHEIHRIDFFTLQQIEHMILSGELVDGMSLVALLLFTRRQ